MYTSINGFKIVPTKKEKIIEFPISMIEAFNCPISHEQIVYPVILNNNVYDKSYIKDWLWMSNKDPLLGINLEIGKVELLPVYNLFLLFLCFERKNNKLYFHCQYGQLELLMEIAKNLFENKYTKKYYTSTIIPQMNVEYTFYPDEYIHFDIEYYKCQLTTTPIKTEKIEKTTLICGIPHVKTTLFDCTCSYQNQKMRYINIDEIINKCFLTKLNLNENTFVNSKGYFIHDELLKLKNNSGVTTTISYLAKINKNQNIKHFMSNILYYVPRFNYCYDFINAHEEELFTPIDYKKIHEYVIKKINFNIATAINNNYKQLDKFFGDSKIDIPFYCDVRNGEMVIYDEYQKMYNENKNKNGFDRMINMISNFINNIELNKFGFGSTINKLKYQYEFPMFRDYKNMIYGIDLGFLVLKNVRIENINIKDGMFIGCTFNEVQFTNVNFSICKFIGSIFQRITFVKCIFQECYFYKNEGNKKHMYIDCQSDGFIDYK